MAAVQHDTAVTATSFHDPTLKEEQQMENGLPKSLSTVGGSRDNYTEYENDIDDGRYYRQQPRNITWRCTKDTTPSTVLLVNYRKLDWEVRSILVDMLPFLKLHLTEICSPSLLESVRNLVLQLVPSPHNTGQLDGLLEDALFKFQGYRMRDVCDELVTVVADVLISELTFLRLTTSVNGAPPGEGVDNEDEVETETAEEEGQ
ncbi:uncharacterized protein LOC142324712 [Lycorma delicatula]|uniref:uncharacterized protein LOC142324712 n=1 Tax=Lycorma delicatula TaxID=130591 RepID=UPI003F513FD5